MNSKVYRQYNQSQQKIVQNAEEFVRDKLGSDPTGHDWWHIERVRRMALRLAEEEGADIYVVELAALLHDIADWKLIDQHAQVVTPREWMEAQKVEPDVVDRVCEIIDTMSFKGAGVTTSMRTMEGAVVQDADRLDAIGAIAIARTFAYGGHKGRPMHDPAVKPQLHSSFEEYKKSTAPTITHFYEKLLLLKDRLNTDSARRLAQSRHSFMERYLEQFFAEWDGQV